MTESTQADVMDQIISNALLKNEAALSGYSKKLDGCSEGIKKVETYIQDKNINIEYAWPIPAVEVDGLKGAMLLWGRYGDRFRLLFDSSELDEHRRRKPLIDARSSVRLVVYRFLADFINALAEEISGIVDETYRMKDARALFSFCLDLYSNGERQKLTVDDEWDRRYQQLRNKSLKLRSKGVLPNVILDSRFAFRLHDSMCIATSTFQGGGGWSSVEDYLDDQFKPLFSYLEFGELPAPPDSPAKAAFSANFKSLDQIPF